jgi:hypothetical protein
MSGVTALGDVLLWGPFPSQFYAPNSPTMPGLSIFIQANQGQHALCTMATTYAMIALHSTRLCWLHGDDDLSHHAGV